VMTDTSLKGAGTPEPFFPQSSQSVAMAYVMAVPVVIAR
jgi:hypothetical protein